MTDPATFPQKRLPCCGYVVDSATVMKAPPDTRPKKDDFTICLKCGAWLRFTSDTGDTRKFDASDILDLEAEQISDMRRASVLIRNGGAR